MRILCVDEAQGAAEDREALLEDKPAIYYVTDYYRPYPIVLARLALLDAAALRDLLSVSWQLTAAKSRTRGRRRRAASPDGSSAT